MAIRLRGSAARLRTPQAQTRLSLLAALYEEISLCYLEGERVALASDPLHALDQASARSDWQQ